MIDEAAVEAPPIPRPEQPRAPRPAMIDTRVSQGQTPVAMVDGLEGASWRGVDEGSPAPTRLPPVRPWARNAGITIGVLAMLIVFGTVLYVIVTGAMRAIQESDPDLAPPEPTVQEAPKTFSETPEVSIIEDGEVPPQPIELPPEVDAYDGAVIDPIEDGDVSEPTP